MDDAWGKHKKARDKKKKELDDEAEQPFEVDEQHELPGFVAQTRELLSRRWLLFALVWLAGRFGWFLPDLARTY